MERLNVLLLLVVAIMILSNCRSEQESTGFNAETLVSDKHVKNDNAILLLNHQYDLLIDTLSFLKLKVISEDVMSSILETTYPTLLVELEDKLVLAKGNWILSSSIPEKCDYFFPIDEKGKIILYNGEIGLSSADRR